jgi:hypothetical protein
MGGGIAYRAMPRKAVQVRLIYKEFSHLSKSVFVMAAMHVVTVFN